MNRLVLIDGNAIMHRAYHALPPLTTPDGKPAHVVYGFVSMIIKIFNDLKPTHMAVAFDRPGPTFREKLYKDYQIQRPKMEDDFISQISLVHDMVDAFGIPMFELDGFEADDIIGSLCRQVRSSRLTDHSKKIDQVIIITGDRDILQLVEDEKVLVFMPTKGLSEGRLYGEKEVVERLGVTPDRIPDYKALAGDSSDNYPGVPGIGPKTAIKLLDKYKTIQYVIETLSDKEQKSARLSYELATIRKDAPIAFDPEKARIESLDTPLVREKLEAFHFPSLIKRLGHGARAAGYEEKKKITKQKDGEVPADQQQLF